MIVIRHICKVGDTPAFTLYSGPLSMFGAKVQIAALEKGLAFELVMVPFDFYKLYTPRHPEVLRINPKRQVLVAWPTGIGGALAAGQRPPAAGLHAGDAVGQPFCPALPAGPAAGRVACQPAASKMGDDPHPCH